MGIKEQKISRSIWEAFKAVQKGDYVTRSGFGLCGCYSEYAPEKYPDYSHAESDTEHAFGCEELAIDLERFLPGKFSPQEWNRIIALLRYHDIGEVDYGDRPDDGSQDREDKNRAELAAFTRVVSVFPAGIRNGMIRDFKLFGELDTNVGNASERDLDVIRFAKLCDKTHAPLRGGLYHLYGRPGSLDHKLKFFGDVTEQDKRYCAVTGGTWLVDNWLIHFIDHYGKYEDFPIFFSICREMMKDLEAKGHSFAWLEGALSTLGIDRDGIYRDWA